MRLISKYLIIFLFIFLCFSLSSYGFERYNRVTKYDSYFKKNSKHFFGPAFDWRYFKSQAIAESNLNSNVKSHVGAKGIMQIMPKTFAEIKYKNPSIKGTARQPKWNIAAGIYYDRSIWKLFKAKRPFKDKLGFMFGAYNAGKGNIFKTQKVAEKAGLNPNKWASVEKKLNKVTGKHSKETIGYVDKIHKIKGVLR
ncbi:MAG: transglycosylase SLT domain-containing protein [Desulfobacula sp.]|nr:transglycosylase SLT domain-containing protein [Desulfobacula sp.]